MDVFVNNKVYKESEIVSRYEVAIDNYSKTVNIEARTAIDMVNKQYIPAIASYVSKLAEGVTYKKQISKAIKCDTEIALITKLSDLLSVMHSKVLELSELQKEAFALSGFEKAKMFCFSVLPCLNALRAVVDEAETITASEYWPVPSYGDLIFRV